MEIPSMGVNLTNFKLEFSCFLRRKISDITEVNFCCWLINRSCYGCLPARIFLAYYFGPFEGIHSIKIYDIPEDIIKSAEDAESLAEMVFHMVALYG
jgi:hypothetical protein